MNNNPVTKRLSWTGVGIMSFASVLYLLLTADAFHLGESTTQSLFPVSLVLFVIGAILMAVFSYVASRSIGKVILKTLLIAGALLFVVIIGSFMIGFSAI